MSTAYLVEAERYLQDKDEAKKMMFWLKSEGYVLPTKFNETGQKVFRYLWKGGLAQVVREKYNGLNLDAMTLTELGKKCLDEYGNKWLEELQMWEEIEGRPADSISNAEDQRQFQEIVDRLNRENEQKMLEEGIKDVRPEQKEDS